MDRNPAEIIKDILPKGTEIKAPDNMSDRILVKWQLEEEAIPSIPPLLSRLVIWIIAACIISFFIWAFSKISFPNANPDLATYFDNVSQELSYSLICYEEILLPTIVVIVLMVLINTFLL